MNEFAAPNVACLCLHHKTDLQPEEARQHSNDDELAEILGGEGLEAPRSHTPVRQARDKASDHS